jgi:putative hydrolase of the HAD superfamily
MAKYKHLFFDLDRTLWDYDSNVHEILSDIHNKYLQSYSIDKDRFIAEFWQYNQALWADYRNGKISKLTLRVHRFVLTLEKLGLTDSKLAKKMSVDYIRMNSEKTNLFPDVIDTLQYLSEKKYKLHVITNGFNEVQFKKIRNSGLESFFQKIVTSDNAGRPKPHAKIFEYALSSVHARKAESLMIGDDWEVDILGAKSFGMDQVYLNDSEMKRQQATFQISEIKELREIL